MTGQYALACLLSTGPIPSEACGLHSANVIEYSVRAEEFMRRRDFIGGLGGTVVAWALGARAEISTKRPLIAALSAITKRENSPLNAFVLGLNELGYVEGQTVDIVYSFAEGHLDRFPVLAAEVVGLRPDVI
jgi:hypothetical protein